MVAREVKLQVLKDETFGTSDDVSLRHLNKLQIQDESVMNSALRCCLTSLINDPL
jgi:hypothetical protein